MCDSLWLMILHRMVIQHTHTQTVFFFYGHGKFVCHREAEKNYCAIFLVDLRDVPASFCSFLWMPALYISNEIRELHSAAVSPQLCTEAHAFFMAASQDEKNCSLRNHQSLCPPPSHRHSNGILLQIISVFSRSLKLKSRQITYCCRPDGVSFWNSWTVTVTYSNH